MATHKAAPRTSRGGHPNHYQPENHMTSPATRCRHIWTCTWAIVPGRQLPPAPVIEEAA